MTFIKMLENAWVQHDSLLCVGLDPDLEKLPAAVKHKAEPIFYFNQGIIDRCAEHVCCFKPQIAYYAAYGAEAALEKTIAYIHANHPSIPVILDAKRGDIGATAAMYAREAFERYGADAVTVNPYMGGDTLQPFLDYPDKGVVVLCRTSNPGSAEFQALQCDGASLANQVAQKAVAWNRNGNVVLVVGATYPEDIATIRAIVGEMPLLIPGIGKQGGDLEAVLRNGLGKRRAGLMINSSRDIIYASKATDFAKAAGVKAAALKQQINEVRDSL